MTICYAGCSSPSAQLIADEDDDILTTRSGQGDINWGRQRANTRLNPDIRTCTDKKRMRELFAEHSVPAPQLRIPSDDNSNEISGIMWAVRHGQVLVGRPDNHKRGRGYWLCKSEEDVRRALRGTRRKHPATHFMEYVDAPREYRVHIFCGKSIRISEKDFHSDNKHDYTTIKPRDLSLRKVRKAAKQAVKAVGLDFGAVDILARGDNNDEVFVLEVNAAPGLGGTMPKLYADAFKRWIRGEWS